MSAIFSPPPDQPKPSPGAPKAVAAASAIQSGKTAVEATSAVLALTGIAASGPALPVVLAVATTLLVMTRMYSQTKTLKDAFGKTYRVVGRVQKVLAKLAGINKVSPGRIQIDLTDLIEAVTEIQKTVAKLAPPKVLAAINETLRAGGSTEQLKAPDGPIAYAKGFLGRWVLSSTSLRDLQQQALNLALQLSVVSAELSLELDKPMNAELAAVPEESVSPQEAADAESKMEQIATAAPAEGGTRRRTRRSRLRRKLSRKR